MAEKLQTFEKIIAEPVEAYGVLRDRLDTYGPNAPFPEFQPAVDYIRGELDSEQHKAVQADHPDLALERREVDILLAHVNLEFVFDDEMAYPYDRPFRAPLPYRPTIDAIESGLRFLDKVSRLAPESQAVPLYHFDRYAYHRHALLSDPDAVLMPTARGITYANFIRTRAAPIGFVGLTGDVIRVDRHQQSPLDFWYHDLNHVRRMTGYSRQSARNHGADTMEQKLALYQSMDEFTMQTLMPAIAELPDDASESDKAVRKLVRVILFEILHETALTSERDSILADILRKPIPQPFEHMVTDRGRPRSVSDTEKLRTPTGNLQSGVSTMVQRDGSPITVRYFHDRALALLANVYNKLNYGFYDDPASPSKSVAPAEYRSPEYVLKATHELFDALEYDDRPSDSELLNLISSREGSEEKFVYQRVATVGETERSAYATEPLPAAQVIELIKKLGKKIVTLTGFSNLGYEDPDRLLGQVEEKLQTLDPETTVINIGATEEGIGAAYHVAKRLGFMTIGVVSALALTYSGHFSNDVDKTYIVNGEQWGGYMPDTEELADTTQVQLAVSDEIHAFGGGDITAAKLKEATKRGIPASYTAADMNHENADKARSANTSDQTPDYRGSAFEVWERLSRNA